MGDVVSEVGVYEAGRNKVSQVQCKQCYPANVLLTEVVSAMVGTSFVIAKLLSSQRRVG